MNHLSSSEKGEWVGAREAGSGRGNLKDGAGVWYGGEREAACLEEGGRWIPM